MVHDKNVVALELQQIIKADRKAIDIIRTAEEKAQDISLKAKEEHNNILQDAALATQKAETEMQENHRREIELHREELHRRFGRHRAAMKELMEQNRERWVQNIVARITAAVPEENQ